jgi:predicted transglutaminase-like cysteine proteinase
MSDFRSRAFRSVAYILALGLSISVLDTASANPRTKKSYRSSEPVSIGIKTPDARVNAQSRLFTINGVLAKRDGHDGASRFAAVNSTDAASDAAPSSPAIAASTSEPFGLHTFRAPDGALWVKWRQAEAALKADEDSITACRANPDLCSPAASRLVEIIDAAQSLTGRARFGHVNRAVNGAVRFVSDMAQHGVPDLWSAPIATFTSGRGDCEDYAIAKYFIMRHLGVAAEDLQLVLVHDKVVRQDHAVLSVRQDGRWIILDNRTNLMLEPTELTSLTPLFTLDQRGVSLFAAPYAARRADENKAAPAAFASATDSRSR